MIKGYYRWMEGRSNRAEFIGPFGKARDPINMRKFFKVFFNLFLIDVPQKHKYCDVLNNVLSSHTRKFLIDKIFS